MNFLGSKSYTSSSYSVSYQEVLGSPKISQDYNLLRVAMTNADIDYGIITFCIDEEKTIPENFNITMHVNDIRDTSITPTKNKAIAPTQALWIPYGSRGYVENQRRRAKTIPDKEALIRWSRMMRFLTPPSVLDVFIGKRYKLPFLTFYAYNNQNMIVSKVDLSSNKHWGHLDFPDQFSKNVKLTNADEIVKVEIIYQTNAAGDIGDINPFYIELKLETL